MIPEEYKYTQQHEWVCLESGDKAKIGLTDYAQSQLGDIVFLNLPAPGSQVEQSDKIGEIESVKAVSDLFAPVSGQVLELNQAAIDNPYLANMSPYTDGWLVRLELSQPSELDTLMNSDQYAGYVAELTQGKAE